MITVLALLMAFLCGCLFTATVAALAAMTRHTAAQVTEE